MKKHSFKYFLNNKRQWKLHELKFDLIILKKLEYPWFVFIRPLFRKLPRNFTFIINCVNWNLAKEFFSLFSSNKKIRTNAKYCFGSRKHKKNVFVFHFFIFIA